MRNQAVKQEVKKTSMEVALDALGKGIARWADKPDRIETAIPGEVRGNRSRGQSGG